MAYVRPGPAAEIHEEGPGRVGDIGGRLTGQHQPNMILWQQRAPGVPKLDGLDVPKPEDDGRLVLGERRAAADLDHALGPDTFDDALRLRSGAPAAAQGLPPNRHTSGVDEHRATLPRQSDG